MILDTLELENFRQFYGKQKVRFSQDKDKNITVIHGRNGAGKTALLNSFLWVFYNTVKLPDVRKLVNERTMSECHVRKRVIVSVKITFAHDDKKYTMYRGIELEKQSKDDLTGRIVNEKLFMDYIDKTGRSKKVENPQEHIEQIIPSNLADLFFFHGEKIDFLSTKEGSHEIKEAIKNIMGLTIIERSISHLKPVMKTFENDMKKHGDVILDKLIEEKEELENIIQDHKHSLDVAGVEIESLKDIKAKIDLKLKELETVKGRQEKRERLESELDQTMNQLMKHINQTRGLLSSSCYAAIISDSFDEILKLFEDKRQKRELPRGIKKQFVQDLLSEHKCICGTHLHEGTKEYDLVASWMAKAGSEGVEESAITLAGYVKDFKTVKINFTENLKSMRQKEDTLHEKIRELEESISEIGKGFEKEEENVKSLEEKRKSTEEKIYSKVGDVRLLQRDIESRKKQVEEKQKEIDDAQIKSVKGLLAKKRYMASKKVHDYLNDKFNGFAKTIRERTQEKIGEIYSNFVKKPYWAVISEEYELNILKRVGDEEIPVGMSTGERQIASLSFIGGLVDIARDQYEQKRDSMYFKGGLYPIIMDSPFGYLDKEYRQEVSEGIPRLAHQVVVLVTATQWDGIVEDSMKSKVDKIFNLEYHDPDEDDVEYEFTKIQEIK